MATVNELLQSAEISHQVDLQQYSNAEVRKVVALLNQTDAELAGRLSAAMARMDGQTYTAVYIDRILASVRELRGQALASVTEALRADLLALGEYEQAYSGARISYCSTGGRHYAAGSPDCIQPAISGQIAIRMDGRDRGGRSGQDTRCYSYRHDGRANHRSDYPQYHGYSVGGI